MCSQKFLCLFHKIWDIIYPLFTYTVLSYNFKFPVNVNTILQQRCDFKQILLCKKINRQLEFTGTGCYFR